VRQESFTKLVNTIRNQSRGIHRKPDMTRGAPGMTYKTEEYTSWLISQNTSRTNTYTETAKLSNTAQDSSLT